MPFRDRFVVTGNVNGKFYFHTYGRDLYAQTPLVQVMEAYDYLRNVLTSNAKRLGNYPVLLGALWGDLERQEKVVDVFGFQVDTSGEWPGNPEVHPLVIRENDEPRREASMSCLEAGRLLLGVEGELLARSESLMNFLDAEMPRHELIERGSKTQYLRV